MSVIDTLLCEDARRVCEALGRRKSFVDVVITSPPYWNLKDYNTPGQIGYGQTMAAYLTDMTAVLKGCLALTKASGSLWLVVDTFREGGEMRLLPFQIAEVAQTVGWKLRDLVVWDKRYSVPWQSRGRLRNVTEFVLFMSKSDAYKYYLDRIKTIDEISRWWVDFPERFNPKGKTPTNIWSIPTRPRGRWRKRSSNNHYCSFPTALVARIIELTTDPGDLVLDPFAGSGIVLAQAAAMQRHYLGLELNPEYVAMFEESVKEEVAAEWKQMLAWRQSQEHAKIDFEHTVMKLRALKYTRQVTRPFIEALASSERDHVQAVLCMAAIPAYFERGRPFEVAILVLVHGRCAGYEVALEAARDRSARPPLTQYGIRSSIDVCTLDEIAGHPTVRGQTLYLYPSYKPRRYTWSGFLENWLELRQQEQFPRTDRVPMLANTAVDVAWALEP